MKQIIIFLILLNSCDNKQEKVTSLLKDDGFITISNDEFNSGSACEIRSIYTLFSEFFADTSSMDIEGQDWYQINLKVDKDNWALIESSMEDFQLLNRVTIKSSHVKTQSGIKIGTTLKEVESKNLTVSVLEDMDDISFNIDEDKISFRIDRKFKRNGEDFRNLARKYSDAKIVEFVVTPICR